MALTNYAALTTEQKKVWSKDLWKQSRLDSYTNRFIGEDRNSVFQRVTELTKTEKGDKAIITLVADLKGDGVAGDQTLEGREEAMQSFDQAILVDQLRHANRSKGRMSEQRSVVRFRENSKSALAYWLADRQDQLVFLTIAGVSYAFTNDGAVRTELMEGNSAFSKLEFAASVAAPSANRRLRWNKSSGALEVGGATSSVTATDTITWEMLVNLREYARRKRIRACREKGEDVYHVFLNTKAMANLKMDADYMQNLRHAAARDPSNPLFTGGSVKVDGLFIHEHQYVYNTLGAASGSKWGSDGLVDGCSVALCGAQALGVADIGEPEWVEKEFDYDNQHGISTGKIFGLLKPKFTSIYESTETPEDFGTVNVFVATK